MYFIHLYKDTNIQSGNLTGHIQDSATFLHLVDSTRKLLYGRKPLQTRGKKYSNTPSIKILLIQFHSPHMNMA